jgi:hypothetical protein
MNLQSSSAAVLISELPAFYPEYVEDNGGRPVFKEGVEIVMNIAHIAHIAWTCGKVSNRCQ